jgi:hypothetical protein
VGEQTHILAAVRLFTCQRAIQNQSRCIGQKSPINASGASSDSSEGAGHRIVEPTVVKAWRKQTARHGDSISPSNLPVRINPNSADHARDAAVKNTAAGVAKGLTDKGIIARRPC